MYKWQHQLYDFKLSTSTVDFPCIKQEMKKSNKSKLQHEDYARYRVNRLIQQMVIDEFISEEI